MIKIVVLFLLALPIACVSWTVTKEEVFREIREYCEYKSKYASHLLVRKFFYLPTCEYCFSHYVTAAFLFFTGFRLGTGWFGYVTAFFALVFVANVYMSLFFRLRLGIKLTGALAKHAVMAAEETERMNKGVQYNYGAAVEGLEHRYKRDEEWWSQFGT